MKKRRIRQRSIGLLSGRSLLLAMVVSFILIILLIITILVKPAFSPINLLPGQDLCAGASSDEKNLYTQGKDKLNITIWTKTDGNQTFTAKLGNKVLRKQNDNEVFYTTGFAPRPVVKYTIVEKCGGVDFVYNVTNVDKLKNGSNLQIVQIEGINQAITGDLYYLYLKDSGNLLSMKMADGSINYTYLGMQYSADPMIYPTWAYSPTIVTVDRNKATNFSVGSSLQYPVLTYNHTTVMLLNRSNPLYFGNSWTHTYRDFNVYSQEKGGFKSVSSLKPGEQRVYTVSLRFSRPDSDYWLFTLVPYKKYFNSIYAKYKTGTKDVSPVRKLQFSDWNFSLNERGYSQSYWNGAKYKLHNSSWDAVANDLALVMDQKGYARSMIWTASGTYHRGAEGDCYLQNSTGGKAMEDGKVVDCNFPSQHMNFLPHLRDLTPFNAVRQKGLKLGFWWGLHAFVPQTKNNATLMDDTWPPHHIVTLNISDPKHKAFRLYQLNRSLAAGTELIGLDYFVAYSAQPFYEIWSWPDEMRSYAKDYYNRNITLIAEASAADIFHTKMSNLYSVCRHVGMNGPDLVSYYLNSQSDVWILYNGGTNSKGQVLCDPNYYMNTIDELQKHAKLGFTPVYKRDQVDVEGTLNISKEVFKLAQCMDGLDNDGKKDGLDFPADPECTSFSDDSETIK